MTERLMKQAAIFIFFFTLFTPFVLLSQDILPKEFTAYGVSKIDDGDLAKARQEALLDAQRKAVMSAVYARISIDDIIKYSHTLKDIYYNSYSFYLNNFRILNDYQHFGIYTLVIQASVNEEALTDELSSVGVMTSKQKPASVLFMLAEKGVADEDYNYWWHGDIIEIDMPGEITARLSSVFKERGFRVIDPFNIEMNKLQEINISEIEPDAARYRRIALDHGAKYLITGQAVLVKTEKQPSGPLVNIQCNIKAKVFDTSSEHPIAHISTFMPGTHIDENSAINDAIARACDGFSEKVFDRIYSHAKDFNQYILNINLKTKDREKAAVLIIETLNSIFPDLKVDNFQRIEDILSVSTKSKMPGAEISEGLLRTHIDGFYFVFVSAKDDVLEFDFLDK